ncbi:MAG: hypothetical protein ACYC4J_12875, partial [Gemmatimonadaceae bacterium]
TIRSGSSGRISFGGLVTAGTAEGERIERMAPVRRALLDGHDANEGTGANHAQCRLALGATRNRVRKSPMYSYILDWEFA